MQGTIYRVASCHWLICKALQHRFQLFWDQSPSLYAGAQYNPKFEGHFPFKAFVGP